MQTYENFLKKQSAGVRDAWRGGTLGTLGTLETPILFGFGPKTGGFLVQKRNETPETPWNTRNTWNTLCGCWDGSFVNISKNSGAKILCPVTEGKTNRECCYFWDGGVVGIVVWKWTKSRGRGCEGWSPFVSRQMGIKPKTSFRHCIPIRCSQWVASHPTHIPRRPKKKPLRGKKVGFAEKKLRL